MATTDSSNTRIIEKPEGTIPLGASMRRWKDNIKMDNQEVE
jgi:hypothetical protein